jgi:hypothetical protein
LLNTRLATCREFADAVRIVFASDFGMGFSFPTIEIGFEKVSRFPNKLHLAIFVGETWLEESGQNSSNR